MSIKHSIASKNRWIGVPDEVKRERMSKIAIDRWSKTSKAYRRRNAMRLLEARKNK